MKIVRWLYFFLKYLYGVLRHSYSRVPKYPYKALLDLDRYFNSSQVQPDILCLGDSVWERVADQDQDRRTLGEIVKSLLEGMYTTATISHSAYHMTIFYELIAGLKATKKRPNLVVLPINMRSFSPQWDLEPRWQYKSEINMLRVYRWSRGNIIGKLKKGASKVPEHLKLLHYEKKVYYPLSKLSTIGQFYNVIDSHPDNDEEKMQRKKQIFIFHYTHPLRPQHAKLTSLVKALNLLMSLKIKVLVYLTPVNSAAARKFIGSGFDRQFSENVRQVTRVLDHFSDTKGFSFADWSMAFPSSLFFYDDIASEHLNENGRLELAKLISHEIKAIISSDNEGETDKEVSG